MDTPDKNGITPRAHYEQLEATIGKACPELEEPEVDQDVEYLLQWFWELDTFRSSNGFGLNPLSLDDILAWYRLHGSQPLLWEVRTLKAMDLARLTAVRRE